MNTNKYTRSMLDSKLEYVLRRVSTRQTQHLKQMLTYNS